MSVLGFALHRDPDLQARIVTSIGESLPGVGAVLTDNLAKVQEHRQSTGVIGLAGLLLAGFGGIDAIRASLRVMWHQDPRVGNIVRTKLQDLVTLAGLGATLLASFGVTAVGAGLLGGRLGGVADRVVALLFGLAADTALFVYLFRRLPRIAWPWRRVLRGALFGAVGFTVLKLLATSYVGRTTTRSTELYGALGAVIGVLVGINLIARLVMFTAAWTVTEPGSDDVLPSATGDLTQSPHDSRGGWHRLSRAIDRVGAAPARPRGAGAEPGREGQPVRR
jgi:membrane protein